MSQSLKGVLIWMVLLIGLVLIGLFIFDKVETDVLIVGMLLCVLAGWGKKQWR